MFIYKRVGSRRISVIHGMAVESELWFQYLAVYLDPPTTPCFRICWSLRGGTWNLLEGTWRVLVEADDSVLDFGAL